MYVYGPISSVLITFGYIDVNSEIYVSKDHQSQGHFLF